MNVIRHCTCSPLLRYIFSLIDSIYASTKKSGVAALSDSTKNSGDGFELDAVDEDDFFPCWLAPLISTTFFFASPFFSSSMSRDRCFSTARLRISSIAFSSAAIRSSSTRFFSFSMRTLSSASAFFSAEISSSS